MSFSHAQPECARETEEGKSSLEECLAKRKVENRLFHTAVQSLGFEAGQCLSLLLF